MTDASAVSPENETPPQQMQGTFVIPSETRLKDFNKDGRFLWNEAQRQHVASEARRAPG